LGHDGRDLISLWGHFPGTQLSVTQQPFLRSSWQNSESLFGEHFHGTTKPAVDRKLTN
jgi:hypothetical protein